MVEMLVKAGADVHARLHGPRDITPIAQVVIKGAGSADMTMLQTLLGEPGVHSHGVRLEVACQWSCTVRHSLCGLLILSGIDALYMLCGHMLLPAKTVAHSCLHSCDAFVTLTSC